MPTVKKLLGDVLGKLLFREATITRVRDVAPGFRELELGGDQLRGAPYGAGDKVQVILDEGARTYSPYGFDGERGAVRLLVYTHGDGPGARWGAAAAAGARVRLFGPRGSLPLSSLRGPVVLFGDETSLAVTRALVDHRGQTGKPDGVDAVLEVSAPGDAADAAGALGLAPTLIARGGGHLAEVERQVRAALERRPGAHLVLTGKAQSIQALRKTLRTPTASTRTKAYWSVGKRGLD